MKFIFFFLFCFVSIAQGENEKFALSKPWLRLLHYDVKGTDHESQVDGQNYFLNPNGKYDPIAEYNSTLQGVISTANEAEESNRVGCRFPARTYLLKQNHPELQEKLKNLQCPKFEKWFITLRGVGVSLVFSSYYLNNPSSAFGHTFMRINKAPTESGKRFELLDYGVNYAANMSPDENPIIYAYKGMFGLFPGTFGSMPYYYKVREYNNAESRDLWEYELNVTQEKVDLMIAHLWELGPTYFDYWYLTENCSYHMFTILEAVDPDLDLTSGLKKYIIPSDTVLHIYEVPNFVRRAVFRPSIRSELFHRTKLMSEDEIYFAIDIVHQKKIPESSDWVQLSDASKARSLDMAIDLVDYQFPKEVQIQDSPETKFKNSLLGRRSQIPVVSPQLVIVPEEKDQPHIAHGSRRMGMGFRAGVKSSYVLFQYKFALHDQLDPMGGYPDYSEIHFGDFQFTVDDQKRKFEFESFSLFEVVSHSPFTALTPDISWRVRIGMDRLRQESCYLCHAPLFMVGPSMTFLLPLDSPLSVNLGARLMTYTTPSAPGNKLFVALGPEARMRYKFNDKFISMIEYFSRQDFNRERDTRQTVEAKLSMQYSFDQSQGFRLTGIDRQFESFGGADWFWYY